MIAVMEFFGLDAPELKRLWAKLSTQYKKDIRTGVKNGSLTY